jgi:hypothetical protein
MKYTFKEYCEFLGAVQFYTNEEKIRNWFRSVFNNMSKDQYGIYKYNGKWVFQEYKDTMYFSALYVEAVLEEEFGMDRKEVYGTVKYFLECWGFRFEDLIKRTLPYYY